MAVKSSGPRVRLAPGPASRYRLASRYSPIGRTAMIWIAQSLVPLVERDRRRPEMEIRGRPRRAERTAARVVVEHVADVLDRLTDVAHPEDVEPGEPPLELPDGIRDRHLRETDRAHPEGGETDRRDESRIGVRKHEVGDDEDRRPEVHQRPHPSRRPPRPDPQSGRDPGAHRDLEDDRLVVRDTAVDLPDDIDDDKCGRGCRGDQPPRRQPA